MGTFSRPDPEEVTGDNSAWTCMEEGRERAIDCCGEGGRSGGVGESVSAWETGVYRVGRRRCPGCLENEIFGRRPELQMNVRTTKQKLVCADELVRSLLGLYPFWTI